MLRKEKEGEKKRKTKNNGIIKSSKKEKPNETDEFVLANWNNDVVAMLLKTCYLFLYLPIQTYIDMPFTTTTKKYIYYTTNGKVKITTIQFN